MDKTIVLCGACRTAVGKFGGSLTNIPSADLGAIVIKEAVKRAGVKPTDINEVIMGCVLQAGLGQSVARQASIKAGLPVEVPAFTINNVCGSGLKAISLAADMILAGDAEVVVAGGTENMSAAPFVLEKARFGYRMNDGKLVDTMIKDGLWEAFNDYHMGVTAENVAAKYGVTRQMQDEFSARSQQRCEAAQKAGKFDEEIVPVPMKVKKETVEFKVDEFPRQGVTVDGIAKLRPAFIPDGTVTAANASGINDGAAAVIVTTLEKAQELGITPMAKIVATASAGVEPSIMGIGPIASTRKALKKCGLTVDDIDLFEANEAFAAQSVAVANELGLDPDKVNVNGGAIAIGHPIGASGCRILVSLLYELKHSGKKLGCATLCVGGGMGVTCIVEAM